LAGGCVRTAEITAPGFLHDVFATNLSAFRGSDLMKQFGPELTQRGFEFAFAEKAFCSVFPDGDVIGVTTSADETLGNLAHHSMADAQTWRSLLKEFEQIGAAVLGVLRKPMPSAAMLSMPLAGARLAMQSSRAFVTEKFENPKVQALWSVWGLHLDFAPDIRGGALYPFLQCMQSSITGLAFGKGGAGNLITALVRLFRDAGGELQLSSPVSQIMVEGGVAVGVISRGSRLDARQAVIANVTPKVLFKLLQRTSGFRRFRYGPGTMMIHLALSDLPEWHDARAREYAYVHIAPTLEMMSAAYNEAVTGVSPKEPVLVVSQPSVVDPSRAPPNGHVVSIQVRPLPASINKEAYAEHVLAIVERYAPGLRRKILTKVVLAPADLERINANLVGGDSLGGSHHLSQQFIFRPFIGWSRYRTQVRRLFMCGASNWPGAGVGTASGWLVGQMLAAE
jgi:phytoene dehydrogenase-like protein